MNFSEVIDKIFKPKQEEAPNKYLEIRQDKFFLNEEKHQHYLKYGWCVIENVIEQREIDSFMNTFDEISKLDGFELDKHLLNSGRLFNPEIRKKTMDVVRENAQTILPRMFDMNKAAKNTAGAFQVKPCHENSDLGIHQDGNVIDEENDYCLFIWIPFCDINEVNGPIWVLSGSHLWGNTQRSLGVPWNFKKHGELLKKFMKPVLINKGDVLIFDPALIHLSTPNFSDKIRHAITITVLRKDYQLIYYFKNPKSGKIIEKYKVNEAFYYDYDFISQPDGSKYPMEEVPYKPFDLSEKEILKLVKKHLPQD